MNLQEIRVVVLAGGKGTRLRPYTTVLPKPLMPIGDMPILEVVLRQLHAYGFRKVTLAVNHMAELIQTFFGDGSKWGLDVCYCIEDRPLGTAGALGLVDGLTEPFLVMNGDLLTTIDYGKLVEAHVDSRASATIAVFPRQVCIDFGVLELDEEGRLAAYREKPQYEFVVSMGVNVLSLDVCEFIPRGEYLEIPTLMANLRDAGRTVRSFRSPCEWLDIGRPDDYEAAVGRFEQARGRYLRENG